MGGEGGIDGGCTSRFEFEEGRGGGGGGIMISKKYFIWNKLIYFHITKDWPNGQPTKNVKFSIMI